MLPYRLLRFFLHVLLGLGICAVVFPLASPASRQRLIRRWSRQLLAICQVALEVVDTAGAQQAPRALIVANHVSWLDIFVINAMQPCRFVAKSDIRDWPVLGWLCSRTGTIFIARGNRRDVRRIFQGLVTSIHAGERVAFFPEGTTGVQGQLLPFHANLFEAAIDAEVPVQPYAIRYSDAAGRDHAAVEFVGDTSMLQSLMAIASGDKIYARLTVLPVIESSGVLRRELAAQCHQAMAQALSLTPVAATCCPAADIAGTPPVPACDLQGIPH